MPEHADMARAAACPLCGEAVVDVDRLARGIVDGTMTFNQLIADMVGHVQVAHPEAVEPLIAQAVRLGLLAPPPDEG